MDRRDLFPVGSGSGSRRQHLGLATDDDSYLLAGDLVFSPIVGNFPYVGMHRQGIAVVVDYQFIQNGNESLKRVNRQECAVGENA